MLLNDLRYAARVLRKSPAFSLAVILTVALGVGANTVIFSVVNAEMLRPLPYHDPGRLVWIAERNDKLHLPTFSTSVLNYLSWKEQQQSFEQMGAFGFGTYTLSGSGEPEQFNGSRLTASVLPMLGVRPILGRGFTEAEEQPGAPPVLLVSERLWKRRFGGDESLVGKSLLINGAERTVVGIVPSSLTTLTNGEMWTPLTIDPGREIRLNHVVLAVGRLKPGVTLRQAQAEMDTVAANVSGQFPAEMKDWGVRVITFFDFFVPGQIQTGLLVLLGAVACVLLIACANVANLLLARAAGRQKEIAVRTAMGASRSRLLRQLLVESLSMSVVGGLVGMTAAFWAVKSLEAALPPNLLPVPGVTVDGTVLAFGLVVTFVTGMLFGAVPAWHSTKTDLNAVLKQSGRSATGGSRPLVRNGLAAAELALATVLLIGAGLLIQSLLQLQRVSPGFTAGGVVTFQVSLPPTRYSPEKAPQFFVQLLESLRATPGVEGAGISSGLPFGVGNYTTTPVVPVGPSALAPDAAIPIDWRIVSPGFFRMMRIPLMHGRDFTDEDGPNAPPVMIVSQSTARKIFGDADPLGRVVHRQGDSVRAYTIVGVVGDVHNQSLSQDSPTLYYPSPARIFASVVDVAVRTPMPPESLLPALRQKLREADPSLPMSNVRTLDEWVANGASQPRLNAGLLGVFAGVALLIAAVGIYGVLAYSVTQRTREIGLRMALGAPRGRVLWLIVREGLLVGAAGIGAGIAAALALSRLLASLLFGVPATDPATYSVVAALLATVALAACSLPALKASRVDPMVALREE